MIKTLSVDLSPVRQSLQEWTQLERDEAELGELETKLHADRPALRKAAAGGSVQSAAQLTIDDCKAEIIPEERAKLQQRRAESIPARRRMVESKLVEVKAAGAARLAQIEQPLADALAPMLIPRSKPDLAFVAAYFTAEGQRVNRLLQNLRLLEGDYPAQCPSEDPDGTKKAARLVAAWEEFEREN